jgi:hypothetical protein
MRTEEAKDTRLVVANNTTKISKLVDLVETDLLSAKTMLVARIIEDVVALWAVTA